MALIESPLSGTKDSNASYCYKRSTIFSIKKTGSTIWLARIDECFLAAFEDDTSGRLVNNGKSFFFTNAALCPGRRALIAQWTGFRAVVFLQLLNLSLLREERLSEIEMRAHLCCFLLCCWTTCTLYSETYPLRWGVREPVNKVNMIVLNRQQSGLDYPLEPFLSD